MVRVLAAGVKARFVRLGGMNILAFDIETIPDLDAGRRLHGLDGLSDEDVGRAMFQKRRQDTGGSEFLPLHLHRVTAISIALRNRDGFKVWTLGTPESDEKDMVARFFDGIEKFSPDLVSWNGSGFDLPVLNYRALRHGLSAPRFWEMGGNDQSYKWNNYISRYHWRHTDLMDVLGMFQGRAGAPLDEMAQLCGFPGKLGMHGSHVWENWLKGNIAGIRDYCETDALNTYLLYLRFEMLRGNLSDEEYKRECSVVRDVLKKSAKPHLDEFLAAWPPVG
jgi:predicted PolB exonuclease-like 3'-5' exonuclease